MNISEQTKLWYEGKSIHNNDRMVNDKKLQGGECCPDFSCCVPELQAPLEVRQVFYNAYLKGDQATQDRLLMEFLGKMLAVKLSEEKVHIVGLESSRRELE